jgi:hypothetical protein
MAQAKLGKFAYPEAVATPSKRFLFNRSGEDLMLEQLR